MDYLQCLRTVYLMPMKRLHRGTESRQAGYQFAIRCLDDSTHKRLRRAAEEDNRTMASELQMLLDLREHWKELVTPDHPLALPLPEVVA